MVEKLEERGRELPWFRLIKWRCTFNLCASCLHPLPILQFHPSSSLISTSVALLNSFHDSLLKSISFRKRPYFLLHSLQLPMTLKCVIVCVSLYGAVVDLNSLLRHINAAWWKEWQFRAQPVDQGGSNCFLTPCEDLNSVKHKAQRRGSFSGEKVEEWRWITS